MVNFVPHVAGIFQVLQVPVVINFPGKSLCTSHIAASTGVWGVGWFGVWHNGVEEGATEKQREERIRGGGDRCYLSVSLVLWLLQDEQEGSAPVHQSHQISAKCNGKGCVAGLGAGGVDTSKCVPSTSRYTTEVYLWLMNRERSSLPRAACTHICIRTHTRTQKV